MRAVSIIGFKNSGKTTLSLALAQALEKMGLRVGIIKRTHHGIDLPHTDTDMLSAPGRTVIAVHDKQSVLFFNEKVPIHALLSLIDADIVLLEGGKKHTWLPRIMCLHYSMESEDLLPELAIASYGQSFSNTVPHFAPEQIEDLAVLLCQKSFALPGLNCGACGFADCGGMTAAIVAGEKSPSDCMALPDELKVRINGKDIGLNPFVARILGGSLRGMLSELKGAAKGGKAELTLTL